NAAFLLKTPSRDRSFTSTCIGAFQLRSRSHRRHPAGADLVRVFWRAGVLLFVFGPGLALCSGSRGIQAPHLFLVRFRVSRFLARFCSRRWLSLPRCYFIGCCALFFRLWFFRLWLRRRFVYRNISVDGYHRRLIWRGRRSWRLLFRRFLLHLLRARRAVCVSSGIVKSGTWLWCSPCYLSLLGVTDLRSFVRQLAAPDHKSNPRDDNQSERRRRVTQHHRREETR